MTIIPPARLHRVRWAVRGALALGVAASVAGNVLHAADGTIVSQIIAAWSPLALLITVELISRVPVHRRLLAAVRWLATATIASIAAWVSYWHMVAVCQRYGETGASPYLLPLSVDGLVVVASVCLVELGGRIRAAADSPTSQEDTTADSAADTADSRPDTIPARVPRVSPETAARIEAAMSTMPPGARREDIATAAGVSAKTVQRYMAGRRTGQQVAAA